MKNNVFKVVLLQALPASGKSEVRNFMAHVEPERLQNEFHIGENLQLDDFPSVHMMRRIDEELDWSYGERTTDREERLYQHAFDTLSAAYGEFIPKN